MGVAEYYIDLEEQINTSKNGLMIIMKSEINSCPRKLRHEQYYYTIKILQKKKEKKKTTKLCTRMLLRKLQYCV